MSGLQPLNYSSILSQGYIPLSRDFALRFYISFLRNFNYYYYQLATTVSWTALPLAGAGGELFNF
jgi:hypothetical protein